MRLDRMSNHIVVSYPLLDKTTIFFREGGAQNFELSLDDLPHHIKKYVDECKAEGRYESLSTAVVPGVVFDDGSVSDSHLTCVIYSSSYPPGTTKQGG